MILLSAVTESLKVNSGATSTEKNPSIIKNWGINDANIELSNINIFFRVVIFVKYTAFC